MNITYFFYLLLVTSKSILRRETYLFWIVPIASLLALVLAWYFYKQMMRESEGTPTMEKIALYVRQGAMSYLKQQYKVVGMVFLGLVILFSLPCIAV